MPRGERFPDVVLFSGNTANGSLALLGRRPNRCKNNARDPGSGERTVLV